MEHFKDLLRNCDHHASIPWLDTERPYIKLLSLEKESLITGIGTEKPLDTCNVSILCTQIGTNNTCSTLHCLHTAHKIFFYKGWFIVWNTHFKPQNSSTVAIYSPVYANPYGFNLSKPSMCHRKFGPLLLYWRLCSLCLTRIDTFWMQNSQSVPYSFFSDQGRGRSPVFATWTDNRYYFPWIEALALCDV